jgi:ABC-type glycerol-3-phosphate transport system permease component
MRYRLAKRWSLFSVLCAITLTINFPIIVLIANSFQTTEQMLATANIFPRTFTVANFEFLSGRTPFWTFLTNSMVLSGGGTILGALPAAWAGYALSRFRGRGLSLYGKLLLVVQMFPIIVALIPLFILFRQIGLINNPLSVMIIHAVIHLPFATWLMRSYFDTIPRELEEAAQVDGCTRVGALRRILLPLSGPGIAAVLIFSFLQSYNEFFIASVFLRDVEVMPIPVGVQMFMQQYSTDWGSLMAAATVTMIPTFVLFLFVQKWIAYGAVAGGVKG